MVNLFSSFQTQIQGDDTNGRYLGAYRIREGFHGGDARPFVQDMTQLQPIHAREIFPCFDQPDMKGE